MSGSAGRTQRSAAASTGARILLAAALALVPLVLGPAPGLAAASDDVYTCPAAPQGWAQFATNPILTGPTSIMGDHTATLEPGSTQEVVNCDYFNANKSHVRVTGDIALPIDLNPINDFYYGCGSRLDSHDVKWDSVNRTMLIQSRTSWAFAIVTDPFHAFENSDVIDFQKVATQLLQSISGKAHTCALDTVNPTEAPASWGFDFELSITTGSNGVFDAFGGIGTSGPARLPLGSFVTEGGPDAKNHYKVTSISLPDVDLTVVQHGASRHLTLKFTKAVRFYYKAPLAAFVVGVKVANSHVPGCPNGSTGTLGATSVFSSTIVGPKTLHLKLCGSLFHPAHQVAVSPTVDITTT
jgi:hypothetical protein